MGPPQYRPQNIIILIMGTPKKVPIILGNPHNVSESKQLTSNLTRRFLQNWGYLFVVALCLLVSISGSPVLGIYQIYSPKAVLSILKSRYELGESGGGGLGIGAILAILVRVILLCCGARALALQFRSFILWHLMRTGDVFLPTCPAYSLRRHCPRSAGEAGGGSKP